MPRMAAAASGVRMAWRRSPMKASTARSWVLSVSMKSAATPKTSSPSGRERSVADALVEGRVGRDHLLEGREAPGQAVALALLRLGLAGQGVLALPGLGGAGEGKIPIARQRPEERLSLRPSASSRRSEYA